jgi:hypothetical protein
MAKFMECPNCGGDISDTYQPPDPEVGIENGGWFCDPCDLFVQEEPWPDDDEPYDRDDYKAGSSGW